MAGDYPAGSRAAASGDKASHPKVRQRLLWAVVAFTLLGIGYAGYTCWTRPRPTPPTEIFRGIIYSCEQADSEECRGLVHLVRIDLSTPGIGLYLTPLDPQAVNRGYQYRLCDAASVLRQEDLAVVVNGAFFAADYFLFYRTGDYAKGLQTVVVDGQLSHLDPNSYMLWFEADLTPHIEFNKPPTESLLRRVRFAIGGGAVPLWQGQVRPAAAGHEMDRRTAVGIDPKRRLLWLAVFENASSLAVARLLQEHGAQDGFLLDGGHSTTMVLGPKAARVRSGALIGGSRPVATCFGIRAQAL